MDFLLPLRHLWIPLSHAGTAAVERPPPQDQVDQLGGAAGPDVDYVHPHLLLWVRMALILSYGKSFWPRGHVCGLLLIDPGH
ncbi:hypothetical protein EV421DRAFT_1842369 [Armillaria borealis]|uniref:Secreted protein n=1 Tax=Armillaria borealis TaxID=47425 RepID=A0AA39J0F6_9AGAR|nr:hypothetical protein EV421DRAFT_1842369 [Armillaria borealis]